MIRIRDETDFHNWFKKNYKKLGFTKILKYDSGNFPDFVVLENGKKIRIELEIKSSNFILHKHQASKVDKVICVKKDADLKVPIVELKNFKVVKPTCKSPYSLTSQIYNLFKNQDILTTAEVSKSLNISWNTAEISLLNLTIDNKVERIKKTGVNLWVLKR